MYKLKLKTKNFSSVVVSKLSGATTYNLAELEYIYKLGDYRVAFPVTYKPNKLIFEVPFTLNLTQFLSGGVSEYQFKFLISEILYIIEKLIANNLSVENLLLDTDCIFVGPAGQSFVFLYQPICNTEMQINVFNLFLDIIYKTVPARADDKETIDGFYYFLCNQKSFDIQAIKDYIVPQKKQNINDSYEQKKKEAPEPKNEGLEQNEQLSENGKSKRTEQIADNVSTPQNDDLNDFYADETTVLNFFDDGDETTVLGSFDETTILGTEMTFPTLTRKSTGEKCKINKSVYKIGKDRQQSDFQISNNGAISRHHATIVSYNKHYYLKDNKSTNKTYLNGKVLEAEKEYELNDGDEIVFADETFEFYL